ncbi:hypothetical protein ACHAXR_009948 [Thalassiosira sp. AJA248-18]
MASRHAQLASLSNIATSPAKRRTVPIIKMSARNAPLRYLMKLYSRHLRQETIVPSAT